MPLYEYRCEKGHTFEVIQKMTDDPVSECERCGRPVQRVFHPVAVHFKGSGFYNTDYGKKGAKAAETGSEAKPDNKPDPKPEKKAEKPEKKASSAD